MTHPDATNPSPADGQDLPGQAGGSQPSGMPAAPPLASDIPAAPAYGQYAQPQYGQYAPSGQQAPYGQPPQGGQPNPYGQQPAMYGAGSQTNVMAIVALVSSFFVALAGIICGAIALKQIARTGEKGRGMALAGLWIGIGSIVLSIVLVILIVVGAIAFRDNPHIVNNFHN